MEEMVAAFLPFFMFIPYLSNRKQLINNFNEKNMRKNSEKSR